MKQPDVRIIKHIAGYYYTLAIFISNTVKFSYMFGIKCLNLFIYYIHSFKFKFDMISSLGSNFD